MWELGKALEMWQGGNVHGRALLSLHTVDCFRIDQWDRLWIVPVNPHYPADPKLFILHDRLRDIGQTGAWRADADRARSIM